MVWMSSEGRRIGNPAARRPAAGSGTPSRTRHTSVLVPPMSKVMAPSKPAATAAADPAITPPAGPDSSNATGRSAASPVGMSPPAEVITSTSSATPDKPRRYERHRGRR